MITTFESCVNSIVKVLNEEFLQPRLISRRFYNQNEDLIKLRQNLWRVIPFMKKIFQTNFNLKSDKLKIIQTWNKLVIINGLLLFDLKTHNIELYFMLVNIQEEFIYFKDKLSSHFF